MFRFPESRGPLVNSSTEEDCVELNFSDGFGIGLHGRSIFVVLMLEEGVAGPQSRSVFPCTHDEVKKKTLPINGDYPGDIAAGTNIFFANCDIFQHQQSARVQAPVLRAIDTEKRFPIDNLQIMSAAKHESFTESQL